jgi:hypothetical protein
VPLLFGGDSEPPKAFGPRLAAVSPVPANTAASTNVRRESDWVLASKDASKESGLFGRMLLSFRWPARLALCLHIAETGAIDSGDG